MAEVGNTVVPDVANIVTICNTGTIATVSYGTAIGVMYKAHELGSVVFLFCFVQEESLHVFVQETRPRFQGAKLTAWELSKAKIPLHLIVDSASGILFYKSRANLVLFGADRVALNGDVANKIGTMNLAVLAHSHNVPVYAVVPTSTIDLTIESGHDIQIESRDSSEVTHINGVRIAADDIDVYNPAFDITESKWLTGIITEEGICYPPYATSLRAVKEQAEQRILHARLSRWKSYQ